MYDTLKKALNIEICRRYKLETNSIDKCGDKYYPSWAVAPALCRLEKRIVNLKEVLQLIKDGEGPIDEVIDQALRDDGRMTR